ncbi:MAG: FAD binding domain-containing protein [Stomatobaculum sp.]
MKYYTPKTMEQLYEALNELPERTLVLGGGTDAVIAMRERNRIPEAILYPGHVPELKKIDSFPDRVEIGASVTMTEAEESECVRERLNALRMGCGNVGSKQIRNKATIAGNIGSASPAGDMLPILYMYGAKLELLGPGNSRRVLPIEQFVIGKGRIALQRNEIISKLIIPGSNETGYRSVFYKLGSRNKVTISRIGIAISAVFDEAKRVSAARVYMGAVSPTPMHIEEAERIMNGNLIDQRVKDAIGEILFRKIWDITPKGYERHDERYYARHYRYYKPYSVQGVVEDGLDLLYKSQS